MAETHKTVIPSLYAIPFLLYLSTSFCGFRVAAVLGAASLPRSTPPTGHRAWQVLALFLVGLPVIGGQSRKGNTFRAGRSNSNLECTSFGLLGNPKGEKQLEHEGSTPTWSIPFVGQLGVNFRGRNHSEPQGTKTKLGAWLVDKCD